MKFLLVLSGLIAFCACNAIPTVPGDNSHYVEGQSRYIWMPDGDGNTHLVDLHEPADEEILKTRNGANNQYWLYTRQNPTTPQVILFNNANSIRLSNYDPTKPLIIIVHGLASNGNAEINKLITSAFLAVQDVNVIVVDWSALANTSYTTASNGLPSVGQYLGNFLVWLINTGGGNWNTLHLIGFSLGGHAIGFAGRTAGGRIGRITGLDPAGPEWFNRLDALNKNDAQYVEAIHTDGTGFGITQRVADADFYPNGGRNQPGCWFSNCSHSRAYELFASSVRTNHFVGRQCTDIGQAQNIQCTGTALNMGNGISNKQGSGIYGLTTGRAWPY